MSKQGQQIKWALFIISRLKLWGKSSTVSMREGKEKTLPYSASGGSWAILCGLRVRVSSRAAGFSVGAALSFRVNDRAHKTSTK